MGIIVKEEGLIIYTENGITSKHREDLESQTDEMIEASSD